MPATCLALLLTALTPAAEPNAPGPADQSAAAVADHYLDLHTRHLQASEWMGRAMAVIGLAALDEPRAVEKLLDVAARDASPAVRAFAWEALHAHAPSLTAAQRRLWLQAGRQLEQKDALRGDLRATLLRLAADEGPTRANRALFARLFANTSTQYPSDFRTLEALRQTLAAWQDPVLAGQLVGAMKDLHAAYRAEYVLGGLATGVAPASGDWRLGSAVMWQRARARYAAWLDRAGLKARMTGLPPYRGRSELLGAPERVTDGGERKWLRKLELPRFQLEQIDVVFVVDSTGSMATAIYWLRQEIIKMMRACGMISRRPRIGVVFYRDHGEEYVVKPIPLTSNAEALFQAVGRETAAGGGDPPEAVYEGLATAILKQKWSSGLRTHRAVVLLGDAPPHEESMPKIQKLMEAAVGRGIGVTCIKALTSAGGTDAGAFDRIAEWAGGRSVWVRFSEGGAAALRGGDDVLTIAIRHPQAPVDAAGSLSTLAPSDKLPNRLVQQVLAASVPPEYQDRVTPFVHVLMECVAAPVPEKHSPFAPSRE